MGLSRFAVQRKITVLMGVLVIGLLGAVSYGRLPIDLFPDFSFPAAAVITSYTGAAPAEVEAHLTRPIEQALATVTGATRVSSSSQEALSIVMVEFGWGTAMDFAALEMREKADQVRRFFPAEAGVPLVVKFDPSMLPVMLISVTGGDDPVLLRELGEGLIRERLERLEGVAAVGVTGGALREVTVEVDSARLASFGISWAQLRAALSTASVNLPGGRVSEWGRDFLVRSVGRFEDLSDLRQLVVGIRYVAPRLGQPTAPVPVRLEEVAQISLQDSMGDSRSRLNAQDSLVLSVQKTSKGNTVQVAARVADELNELKSRLPSGAEFAVTMNQAEFINRSVQHVGQSALWGAGLAVVLLLIFLLDLGSVLVVALSIPVSVVATMILLYFGGLTLNLMTLSGLALGVGMLVDNSIVVLDNIFRHAQEGRDPRTAAVEGAAEVAAPITSSTLTTVAVFLPVVFVGGIAGTLFRDLAITVTFALGASLLVALTFVPAAASVMIGSIAAASLARTERMGKGYAWLLHRVMRHRAEVVAMCILALAATVLAGRQLGGEFLPRLDRGEFVISVEMPPGTSLSRTDETISEIEKTALVIPEVRYVTSAVGSDGMMRISRQGDGGTAADTGSVTVKLVSRRARFRSTAEIMAELERRIWVPGARVTVEEITFFGAAGMVTPVEILVRGPELGVLQDLAEAVHREVAVISGVSDLRTSSRTGRPELRIQYDRNKLAALGLNPVAVGEQVRGALAGVTVGRLQLAADTGDGAAGGVGAGEVDVVLRHRPEDRASVEQVRRISIALPSGGAVRLYQVATITEALGPTAIQREGGQRVITLSSGVSGRDLASVTRDIRSAVARLEVPDGYEIEYGGEQREMADAFTGLGQAMWLAVALVYMVMAAQFESLWHPLVIVFTIPLAAIGAIGGLNLAGYPFSVSSIIGLILLAGIVVNNAIILVDRINRLRERGLGRDVAVAVAARDRLRPILMTALTTILAMVPLAARGGEGSEIAAPMAVAVIGGLTSATLLTLIVIPVVYTLLDDLLVRICGGRGAPLLRTDDLVD
ncbi:MAG: efflux RND transporter permease subunit [Bacillota bacterium]|nr:efflux RND transporter permease subunit [Bacillota bacterium]